MHFLQFRSTPQSPIEIMEALIVALRVEGAGCEVARVVSAYPARIVRLLGFRVFDFWGSG